MKIPHASEREISILPALPGKRMDCLLRCHCIGGSSKSSQAQTTATGQGTVASGGAAVAQPGSVAIGSNAEFASPGAIQAKGNLSLGNVDVRAGSNSNIQFGLGGGDLQSLVSDITQASASQIAAVTNAAQQTQADLLGQVGTLAQNAQTGTDTTKNTSLILLAAGAILGIVIIARKSK